VNGAPKPLPRIRSVPSYQEVFNVIETEILAKRLQPGDLIPTETELAETLGVNRSTVREGIRLLEQTGLVRREAGRRLYVSVPQHIELSIRMSRAMVLHQITFREYWEVQMVLEPLAASLAAHRISRAALDALEANVVATEAAQLAGDPLADFDVEFHALIAAATENRALTLAREPIGLLVYPTVVPMMRRLKQSAPRLAKAHRIIFNAIRDRDAETAEAWMRRHIVDFRRGYELAKLDMEKPVDLLTP
jgi:GntR family transcriptional repressor for pyruvate dehydrogenase complex